MRGISKQSLIAAVVVGVVAMLVGVSLAGAGIVAETGQQHAQFGIEDRPTDAERVAATADDANPPHIPESSMAPVATVRTDSPTLSIDVFDPDFDDGEFVQLSWYVNGTQVDQYKVNSNGTYTTSVGPLPDGEHDWYVIAVGEQGFGDIFNTKSAYGNKTFIVDHYNPEISDVSPSGNLDSEPTTASALINDTDFALNGDSVEVNISVDGSQITSQTISQNNTVSTSLPSSAKTAGEHTITVNATDSYGAKVTETDVYRVPSDLFVRNETNHSELVAADGEIRFYGEDEVFNRTASGGILNMTGLPVNQDFVVEIEPTSGDFTERTAYIESIYEQQSVYVLNTTAYDTIETRFELDDPTGEYDAQSVVKVKRAINTSSKTTFQTIVADRFGTEGVTATLQNDTRYRIAVTDGTDEQSVGPYRATISETVQVQPGQPGIPLGPPENGWQANAVIDNDTISYRYLDQNETTDELTVWIYERGNQANQLQANDTYRNLGEASGKASLTVNQTEKEWVVEFLVDRDGETQRKAVVLGNQQDVTPAVDDGWRTMIAVGMLILLAGAFSMLNAGIGAIIISIAGGVLWFVGFLAGVTSAAAVLVALFVSVLGKVYSRTG